MVANSDELKLYPPPHLCGEYCSSPLIEIARPSAHFDFYDIRSNTELLDSLEHVADSRNRQHVESVQSFMLVNNLSHIEFCESFISLCPNASASPRFSSVVLICRLCLFSILVVSVPITGSWCLTLICLFVHCFAFEKATQDFRRGQILRNAG